VRFYYPIEFEIPDDWLAAADISGFTPQHVAYARSPVDYPSAIVSVRRICPPLRVPGKPWFDQERMVALLQAIKAGVELPPVIVHEPPDQPDFQYAVKDGVHRFYASAAAGFKYLPVTVVPYDDSTDG
jgi:hypothetical protein